MSFVIAGFVLLLALLLGTVFDADDKPGKDDPAGPYSEVAQILPAQLRRAIPVSNALPVRGGYKYL